MVHPADRLPLDDVEDAGCSQEGTNCCIRLCAFICVWSWMFSLAAVITVPHIADAFDDLTPETKLHWSAALGGGFLLLTCCCCCTCCICICYAPPDDDLEASKGSLRRSSLGVDRSFEWVAKAVEELNGRGVLSDRSSRLAASNLRRMSNVVVLSEQGFVQRASSLRTSTLRASTNLRASSLRASNLAASNGRVPVRGGGTRVAPQ